MGLSEDPAKKYTFNPAPILLTVQTGTAVKYAMGPKQSKIIQTDLPEIELLLHELQSLQSRLPEIFFWPCT